MYGLLMGYYYLGISLVIERPYDELSRPWRQRSIWKNQAFAVRYFTQYYIPGFRTATL